MKRKPMNADVLTVIGMMASIAGILLCLFFLFTPATFGAVGANPVMDRYPDLQLSVRWIQPILGQAIVEDALIRRRANGAQPVAEEASRPAPGSVQWIVGRVIVELNQTRMVVGMPADERDGERIVTIARHAAEQFL